MEATKTALITGATDGIGKATALKLVHEGWSVVFVGRSPERLRATAEEIRVSSSQANVETIRADLASMADIVALAKAFSARHRSLDFLFLNANTITQQHRVTAEGFEANLAVGHLGRALLAWKLEPVLAATQGSQILSTVGLNLARFDLGDPTAAASNKAMVALGRWQWAQQVFSRVWNEKSLVPMNIFMPGIVKTKILDSEPGFARIMIKLIMAFVAITPAKSAEQVVATLEDVRRSGSRDSYYDRGQSKGKRDLSLEPGDLERVWTATEAALKGFRD